MNQKIIKINVFADLCTCGSGKIIANCCYASINTTPPGQKTGYSHPKCYAKSLKDCSRKLSREHYISEGVLNIFQPKFIEVFGFNWLDAGQSQKLSTTGLASKILCERHNTALSGLDAIAKKFFSFIFGKCGDQWALIIRGVEIERWMLKVLCGMNYTGNIQFGGVNYSTDEVNSEYLETLFYSKSIPDGCGLVYVLESEKNVNQKKISWDPLVHESFGLIGCIFRFGYFRILYSLVPVNDTQHIPGEQRGLRYQPKTIFIKHGDSLREVHFGWPSGKDVTLEVHKM